MNKKKPAIYAAALAAMALLTACHHDDLPVSTTGSAAYPHDAELRVNQVQVLGTHNSYHVDRVADTDTPLIELFQGNVLYEFLRGSIFDYREQTLTQQLDAGVRQFELDVWADAAGGAWATAPLLLGTHPDFTFGVPALDDPGLKVFHVAQIDQKTSCYTLVDCLTEIHDWSIAHPGHVPLAVMIEIKDEDLLGTAPGLAQWTSTEYDALDAEIRSVFAAEKIITPDVVQGGYATLRAAIETGGWPTLAASRGKVLFLNCACLTSDPVRQVNDYLMPDGSLTGRVMFTNTTPLVTDPENLPATSAFFLADDPVAQAAQIAAMVGQGYIVRTRADEVKITGPSLDPARRDAALASGAQFVGTDFIAADPVTAPDWSVSIPDGTPARCNPVSAPDFCTAADIENPDALLAPL